MDRVVQFKMGIEDTNQVWEKAAVEIDKSIEASGEKWNVDGKLMEYHMFEKKIDVQSECKSSLMNLDNRFKR
jgi:hypothetical protein